VRETVAAFRYVPRVALQVKLLTSSSPNISPRDQTGTHDTASDADRSILEYKVAYEISFQLDSPSLGTHTTNVDTQNLSTRAQNSSSTALYFPTRRASPNALPSLMLLARLINIRVSNLAKGLFGRLYLLRLWRTW
jgi:hypothetical protein